MWATPARADAGRHDRHHRVHRPAQQALRRPARGRLRQPDRAAGGGVRLPGPQRGRQDDDAADGPRPGPAQQRDGDRARRTAGHPGRRGPGGRAGRGAGLLPPPQRPGQPAGAGPVPRGGRRRRRCGAGPGGPGRPRRRPVQPLLPRHEAAPRGRRGPARRSRPAGAGRAHQRPGPGRHGRHAVTAGRRGGRWADRRPLQPPAHRGAGGLRPGGRHRRRPAADGGDSRRAARRHRGAAAGRAARRGARDRHAGHRRRRGGGRRGRGAARARRPRRRPAADQGAGHGRRRRAGGDLGGAVAGGGVPGDDRSTDARGEHPMTGVAGSVRAEGLRVRRWPAYWVLIGVWFALDLTFVYVFPYIAYRTGGGPAGDAGIPRAQLLADVLPGAVPVAAVQGTPLFGGAILLILGALTGGSGYGWGTWKTVFTQGPGRATAFTGTLVVLALTVVGLVVATFALDLTVAGVLAAVEDQPVDLPSIGALAQGAGTGMLVLGMWCAAGVLIGLLTRSPALAVGLGLDWALVVENLLRGVADLIGGLAVVTDHLPGTAAGSLVGALDEAGSDRAPGIQTILTAGTAAAFLVGWLLLFAVGGLAAIRRRDIA